MTTHEEPVAKQTGYRLLAVVAILAQLVLLFYFLVMGLGWGGFWYLANLGQAMVVLGIAVVLLGKRPLWVLPLPAVSLLLMLAFQTVDPSTRTTDCTDVELSAVAELPPPQGTPPLDFQSEPANGCITRFTSTLSGEQLINHYRRTAEQAGWSVGELGEVVPEPGEEAPRSPGSLDMSNEDVTAAVHYEQAGDEGPTADQLWVVVEVHERNE
jgi:hypothetical protein